MAEDMGSVGSAFIEIRARADKQSIAQEIEKAKTEAQSQADRTSPAPGPMPSPGLPPQFGAGIAAHRRALEEAGAAKLREQIAARHAARRAEREGTTSEDEAKKSLAAKLTKESTAFAGNLEKSNKGFADALAMATMSRGAAGAAGAVGGAAIGVGGIATAGLAIPLLMAAKAYGDWPGYRSDVHIANPMLGFHSRQIERDREGVRGRGSIASEMQMQQKEREALDAREHWRREAEQGRRPPVTNKIRWEQDWQQASRVMGNAVQSIDNWLSGTSNVKSKAKGMSLGAGGYEGLGQHFGGPVELIQAAQSAASMTYRPEEKQVAALEANTNAVNNLAGKMFQGAVDGASVGGVGGAGVAAGLMVGALFREAIGPQ